MGSGCAAGAPCVPETSWRAVSDQAELIYRYRFASFAAASAPPEGAPGGDSSVPKPPEPLEGDVASIPLDVIARYAAASPAGTAPRDFSALLAS